MKIADYNEPYTLLRQIETPGGATVSVIKRANWDRNPLWLPARIDWAASAPVSPEVVGEFIEALGAAIQYAKELDEANPPQSFVHKNQNRWVMP